MIRFLYICLRGYVEAVFASVMGRPVEPVLERCRERLLDPEYISEKEKDPYFNREYARPKNIKS